MGGLGEVHMCNCPMDVLLKRDRSPGYGDWLYMSLLTTLRAALCDTAAVVVVRLIPFRGGNLVERERRKLILNYEGRIVDSLLNS